MEQAIEPPPVQKFISKLHVKPLRALGRLFNIPWDKETSKSNGWKVYKKQYVGMIQTALIQKGYNKDIVFVKGGLLFIKKKGSTEIKQEDVFYNNEEGDPLTVNTEQDATAEEMAEMEGMTAVDEDQGHIVENPFKYYTKFKEEFKDVKLKDLKAKIEKGKKEAENARKHLSLRLTAGNASESELNFIRRRILDYENIVKKYGFLKLKDEDFAYFATVNENDSLQHTKIEKILKRITAFDIMEIKKEKPSIKELFENIPETAEEIDEFNKYLDENHKGQIPKKMTVDYETLKNPLKETEKKLNTLSIEDRIERLNKNKLYFGQDKIDRLHKRHMGWDEAIQRMTQQKRF